MKRRNQSIVRFILMLAALCALSSAGPAQSKGPSQFDVDGVRLGMSVNEAYGALQTYGFKYIAKVQFGSRLGKGPFIGALVGMTGKEYSSDFHGDDRGDHVCVLFTETDGKAYSIDRTMKYGVDTPTAWDVLRQKVREKYGDPTPKPPSFLPVPPGTLEFWVYDPGGKPISGPWNAMISNWSSHAALWSYCATQTTPALNDSILNQNHFFDDTVGQALGNHGGGTEDGIFAPIPYPVPQKPGYPSLNRGDYQLYSPLRGWSQPGVGLGPMHGFNSVCGVTLKITYAWGGERGPGVLVEGFEVGLLDNHLASKNMVNLINYANGVKARQLDDIRKKSEQQTPFSPASAPSGSANPAVSTEVQSPPVTTPSPAPASPANPASPAAPPASDPLTAVWQSDAFAGQTFRFRLNGNAVEVYGGQQQPLGTLEAKEKKGAIAMYQGLVQIGPLTQCPGGRGLMQIRTWNDSRLDARIETPLSGPSGVTCGGVMGTGRLVRWQQVTFVKK